MSRTCGRPTRAGTPCKNYLWGDNPYKVACGTHESENDRALQKAFLEGRNRYEDEHSNDCWQKQQKEASARRTAELEATKRTTDASGAQIVCVGRYAYTWSGDEPLNIGDVVQLPQSWLNELHGEDGWTAKVTSLGTNYDGPLASVVRLVKKAEMQAA